MYGFVTVSGHLFAVPAEQGCAKVAFGGILYDARQPITADERHAARALEADLRRAAQRPAIRELTGRDAVALMAAKIVERSRAAGEVAREDFRQAGIPDHLIEANRDAAFARARRIEPNLDAMAGAL